MGYEYEISHTPVYRIIGDQYILVLPVAWRRNLLHVDCRLENCVVTVMRIYVDNASVDDILRRKGPSISLSCYVRDGLTFLYPCIHCEFVNRLVIVYRAVPRKF